MPDTQNFLNWFILLACILPFVVILIGAAIAYWFGRAWLEKLIEPDTEAIATRFEQLRARNPAASRQQLIDIIVREQAIKCGLIGAITGLTGFFTLPIFLPIDLILSARYQASMVSFIAQTFGFHNRLENQIATNLVLSGSSRLSLMSLQIIQKYAPSVAGKAFSKLIPVLGAAISFAINYALAQSMARAAVKWYSTRSKSEILSHSEGKL
jgi:hypothetical protein